ncbi:MAG: D-alanyl-D-alanine carboxypeptidase, partial [Treponema sp.]|nr:D-alanyl-D-alanine carboxypeptidase [Treponema sp.]
MAQKSPIKKNKRDRARTTNSAAWLKQLAVRAACGIVVLYGMLVGWRAFSFKYAPAPPALTREQEAELAALLDAAYPERDEILSPLSYQTTPPHRTISARAAIVVDTASGAVLYEKNADDVIPPASMTKLAVMYVVFAEIAAGRIALDDVVPLPPESWASHMPPHSSLMFLGKNQRVTLDELLTGLAVSSGNDAAAAIAAYVSGGMPAFITRMNSEMAALGLTRTHFVDASGYSEKNTTTARDMAAFARIYILRYPEALTRYHARLSFTYPAEHNLAPEDRGKPRAQDWSQGLSDSITMGIHQENTNKLLGVLDGCDGLKTGYIDESGYNLALTATRNGTRFLSVTLGGPGKTVQEGNEHRMRDGTALMEWAFAHFADCKKTDRLHPYLVRVTGAQQTHVHVVPAFTPGAVTVPFIAENSPAAAAAAVRVEIVLPDYIPGGTRIGQAYGAVQYYLKETLLLSVPLVADKTVRRAFPL